MRAPHRCPKASLCLLIPTASYLAYANGTEAPSTRRSYAIGDRVHARCCRTSTSRCLQERRRVRPVDVRFLHNDGAGVCFSTSYHRPIINLQSEISSARHWRPCGSSPADLSIVGWLEHQKYDYEVHDRRGPASRRRGRAETLSRRHQRARTANIIRSGCWTRRRITSSEGGRLLYLSGNGYYWTVGFRDDEPWIMEVRKLEAGLARLAGASRRALPRPARASAAVIWRHRNRAPQKLLGVGYTVAGHGSPRCRIAACRTAITALGVLGFRGRDRRGVRRFRPERAAARRASEVDRYELALGHAAARDDPGVVGAIHRQLSRWCRRR